MTNLLKETEYVLEHYNKTPSDIDWIGSYDGKYAISWEEFKNLAVSVSYDAGFGAQKIASDIVIVFKDGDWLSRYEYDGSEAWELHSLPKKSANPKPIYRLCVTEKEIGWKVIAELNKKTKQ